MNILQLITELTPAGAEKIVCELSKGMSERGHELTVVSLMPLPDNEAILCELRDSGIDVLSLKLTKFTPWRICGLRRIIKKFKPDIVHSHLIHSNIIARLAKLANSVDFKLINTVHIAERRPEKWWHFLFDRLTFGLCDCQTAVSKAVRDFHSQKINVDTEDIQVVYNGIQQPDSIADDKVQQLREEWGVSDCDKILGSVGRLDWQKGYDIFLQKLDLLSDKIPENEKWAVVIIGEGKQRKELENIIQKADNDNLKVVLTGFRKDAAECIGAFDLFFMPSRYEGFGLTLIEAMSHGIPIIASDADSLPELMSKYKNGKCVNLSNKKQFAEMLYKWAYKDFIKPEKCFSVDEMTDKYIRIYKSL